MGGNLFLLEQGVNGLHQVNAHIFDKGHVQFPLSGKLIQIGTDILLHLGRLTGREGAAPFPHLFLIIRKRILLIVPGRTGAPFSGHIVVRTDPDLGVCLGRVLDACPQGVVQVDPARQILLHKGTQLLMKLEQTRLAPFVPFPDYDADFPARQSEKRLDGQAQVLRHLLQDVQGRILFPAADLLGGIVQDADAEHEPRLGLIADGIPRMFHGLGDFVQQELLPKPLLAIPQSCLGVAFGAFQAAQPQGLVSGPEQMPLQLRIGDGLEEVGKAVQLQRFLGIVEAGKAGVKQRDHVQLIVPHPLQQFQPAAARHLDIGQQYGDILFLKNLPGSFRALGQIHLPEAQPFPVHTVHDSLYHIQVIVHQ